MSERRDEFRVGDRPRVEVRYTAGSLRVVTGEPGIVVVGVDGGALDRFITEQVGDTVVVSTERGGWFLRSSYDVALTVPPATELEVRVGSADVGVDGVVRAVRARLGSGDVRLAGVDEVADVKVASGDVSIGDVGGRLEVSAASGDLEVARVAGTAKAGTVSGDIRLGRVMGRAEAHTASGDITIDTFEGPVLAARTVSGTVRVGIPAGRRVYLDVQTTAGSVRNEFDFVADQTARGESEVRVKTISGDVLIVPARG